jgi:hypothetical protein
MIHAMNIQSLRKYLTFVGPCIVSIFQYMSNKMQRYTVYLYLETALHVSGGTSTHHQERIQLYLQHLVFVTPLLLPAPLVEELELQETAVHVSGCTITHHQERKQLYLQHLVFVTPLLLYAAIVEELELWNITSSNSSTIAADSSNGVTNTRFCRYSCMCS